MFDHILTEKESIKAKIIQLQAILDKDKYYSMSDDSSYVIKMNKIQIDINKLKEELKDAS